MFLGDGLEGLEQAVISIVDTHSALSSSKTIRDSTADQEGRAGDERLSKIAPLTDNVVLKRRAGDWATLAPHP